MDDPAPVAAWNRLMISWPTTVGSVMEEVGWHDGHLQVSPASQVPKVYHLSPGRLRRPVLHPVDIPEEWDHAIPYRDLPSLVELHEAVLPEVASVQRCADFLSAFFLQFYTFSSLFVFDGCLSFLRE